MRPIDKNQINLITANRATIETNLTKALCLVFGEEPIISSLRKVVAAAIENLVPLINDKPTNKVITDRLVGDEHKNLVVWKYAKTHNVLVEWDPGNRETWTFKPPFKNWKNAQAALYRVWLCKNSWSASDCSDLIRLFGDLCEQNKGAAVYADQDPKYSAHYNINKKEFEEFKPDKYFFAIDPAKDGKPAYRIQRDEFLRQNVPSRTRASGDNKEKLAAGTPAPHIAAGRDKIKYVKLGGAQAKGGIDLYRLMPNSTVRKIDIAFGLPEGADASGTTADSILVINRVKSFADAYKALQIDIGLGDEEGILQLLPLVTMVSQGHHTLFESALTLTYHNFINYAVGFYHTLLPDVKGGVMPAAVGKIRTLLNAADSDPKNKHILAYYDPVGEVYEGFLFEKEEEIDSLKRFASMRGQPPISREGDTDLPWLNKFRDQVSPAVKRGELVKIGAPIPPAPKEKHTVRSADFKYSDGVRSFRQTGGNNFEDQAGNRFIKCLKTDPNAFEIKIKGFPYGWLRPA
ncbi:hypothetical protein PITCH_A1530005 [uncultured Desulfobacterium sp.]|uniref:Uncharacterized protein n=1 Tax=uncultured Desulfobacterium sp. TaxID=201089 RepID=A0A445MTK2_9BACT|nr:hypothetical protein PITCH_A1530005 [uncultured Desulfobacterium sp.]